MLFKLKNETLISIFGFFIIFVGIYCFCEPYLSKKTVSIKKTETVYEYVDLRYFGEHVPGNTPKQIAAKFGQPLEEIALTENLDDYTWLYNESNGRIRYYFSKRDFLNKSYIKLKPEALAISDVLKKPIESFFRIKTYIFKEHGKTVLRIYVASNGNIKSIDWCYKE